MNIPTRIEAEHLISEAQLLNPGPWVNHSRYVAECAQKIARECKGLDSESAYILGLLHDIGRRFGVSDFKHIVDGYHYMNELRFTDAARICLTHSFQNQNIDSYIGKFDAPRDDINEIDYLIQSIEYNDYDKLIQLCDSLATAEGVVKIEVRLADVARRYLNSEYPSEKSAVIYDLKRFFEEKTGKSIYEIVL